ncbi:MAG TPA: heparan-alpha-glucosaminide N-acetyltransferase domain-containing protein [Ignavibacteriaceae bacterium]|nr:heparan-alpha-glucosaminide N-acetyltransferase domain-containing protein [Ignavibacteriaceae bacterium]
MTENRQKQRVIFLDLFRAFAVLMMVQGHTIDAVLSNSLKDINSTTYTTWLFFRGLTAPIFLFTSGTVFIYLFNLNNKPFRENERVKKGLKRFLLLVFIGYVLRYPTFKIVDFSDVEDVQWKIFYAVDVLHLIGFGIFFLIAIEFFSEKLKINSNVLLTGSGLLVFLIFPVTEMIDWVKFLPWPIAGYFYKGTGSNFPLIPWIGYIFFGGVLGNILASNKVNFRDIKFSIFMFAIGFMIVGLSQLSDSFEIALTGVSTYWTISPNLHFFRFGIVLILTSIFSFISIEIHSIPKLIIVIGQNTLVIYCVHLVLLYGSAWNPLGIFLFIPHRLGLGLTLLVTLAMITLMIIMVYYLNKYKIKRKLKTKNEKK